MVIVGWLMMMNAKQDGSCLPLSPLALSLLCYHHHHHPLPPFTTHLTVNRTGNQIVTRGVGSAAGAGVTLTHVDDLPRLQRSLACEVVTAGSLWWSTDSGTSGITSGCVIAGQDGTTN